MGWQPRLWLWLVPACLPWLNFSPWTGWIVFEEFDLLLLAALAGAYARMAWESQKDAYRPATTAPKLLIGMLAVSGLWALQRGLLDAGGFQFDWFASYSDALNSWRVFKSLGFALLFIPLLQREVSRNTTGAAGDMAAGIVSGLACLVLATFWERMAFPGLLDFSAPYRTVALFWEMHVGGAAIDAYLALTVPFVVWALSATLRPLPWAALALLALGVGYTCLTTFSRGVYLAVLGPLILLPFLLWLQKHARHGTDPWRSLRHQATLPSWWTKASVALGVVLMLEVVVVLQSGSFMSKRLASTEQDLSSRVEHWKNGVGMLKGSSDWLLGIGLGRLPANYAAQVPNEEFPGDALWHPEPLPKPQGQGFVTLLGPKTRQSLGGVLELTQRVSLSKPSGYRARLDVRVKHNTRIELYLCERHLLYDRACQAAFLRVKPVTSAGHPVWQSLTVTMEGDELGPDSRWVPRLKMFSMSVIDAGGSADIDNVALMGDQPQNLLSNGDFSAGLAHWLPAAQSYFLPWHLDNLFLELLVERGVLGLLACLLLVMTALWHLALGRARLQPTAPYLAASIIGVLLVGLVSSVMDVPRVAFLFFLLNFMALAVRPNDTDHVAKGHERVVLL
ncbi:O-antigen ligase family protein [Rhodoferax antarcticus]|uniref:O-antigen ligase family protein n=1 Tax=Rhodoferax antarcticus TaxID=81479 RepID=UPI001301427C|nr:O-antigen ligase family protein [Rhodoferax antarcticus]